MCLEDRFGAGESPAGSGDVEAVGHDVAAGTFDDAGGDGPAAGQGGWVVQVGRLAGQVVGGVVGAFALGRAQAGLGGLATDPLFCGGIGLGVQAPGGLPQVLHDMDQVADNGDVDVAGFGFGLDPVDLVDVAVDQRDPGPGVLGVAAVGFVEDPRDHGGGVLLDARDEPLVGG